VKDAQSILQKTITWTINMGKRSMNGEKLTLNAGCHFENLNLSKPNWHSKSSCF
jgi:hypothetical protein